MSALALALVLTAAVLHATWNLSAKRAAGGDSVACVLLMSVARVRRSRSRSGVVAFAFA